MAVLAAAQLLDELMGRHRNINANEKVRAPNWEDSEFCKYYMVKFCPHDLFVNTRADLGVCPRVHDDEVKALYEKAEPCMKKTMYQDEFLRFCDNMIGDIERKIQKGKQRLELMNSKNEGTAMNQAQTEKNQEQIKALTEKISGLVQEMEEAGTRGDVEQAQGLMMMCEQLKEEKENLQKQCDSSHWTMTAELAAAQEKQMEVCATCGAFLIVGDAPQRIDDHLTGKQHVGYFKLREAYTEMSAEREKRREEERSRREHSGRGAVGGSSDRERRDRERERERRDQLRRDSSRAPRDEREKDIKNDRDHSKRSSRERSSRHGDKDRKHRSERDRGSERDKESRRSGSSRDGSRRHRSRSRGRADR